MTKNAFMSLLLMLSIIGGNVAAQAKESYRISIKAKRIPLKNVFSEIKKQTGLVVFYDHDILNDQQLVDVDFEKTDINTAFEILLKNQAVDFRISGKYFILSKKAPPKTPADRIGNVTVRQDSLQVIKGKIMESDRGPIPGATVMNLSRKRNAMSDADGNFSIQGLPGDSIRFNYIGLKPKTLVFNQIVLKEVILTSDVSTLNDVVITGYQVVDKRTFTGSVSKVKSDELATAGISDVGKSLQGMVAGVSVENSSGTFGTKSKIRIRGNSSISGNQEPLWVVDGIVLDDPINVNPNQLYSGDAATMLSSAISGINPDDIEDIQILKDASATAMYGTQAVNGVIVVTTKKGKIGSPSINYKNSFSLAMKPSITQFNVMDSKQRMEFSEELYAKNLMDFTNLNQNYGAYGKLLNQLSKKDITWDGFYDGIQRAKTYNTDWFDVLFRNALTQEHSLSVSSGTEKAQYYMSGSYFNDNGQTSGQYTNRFTANMRGNFNLSDKFTLTATLYASARNQRMFGAYDATESVAGIVQRDFDINPYNYARNTSRAMRAYDDKGNLEFYQTNFAPFNILHELDNNFLDIRSREVRFQLDGQWKIAKKLTYQGIASGRMSSAYSEHVATERSNVAESYRATGLSIRTQNPLLYDDPYDDNQYPISVLPRGGIVINDNTLADFYTIRNSINWKPVVAERHSFDLLAGSEIRHKMYYTDYYKGWGYDYNRGMTASPDYRAIQRELLSANGSPYYGKGQSVQNEASFFANLAYTFNHKYNLTFSVRADGSNKLGASERFRFLPIWVVGGSWNADDEDFLKDVSWLDQLKLRGSYGKRGNISGLGSPEMLAYFGTTTRFDPNTIENSITISAPDNPVMQWEKEKMSNIAIEMGFLGRFTTTLEYYHRKNYDLIGNIEVSRVSGFQRKTLNWADMKNQGLEITINTHNIKHKDFDWNTIVTYGYNKNTVTRMTNSNTVLQATVDKGSAAVGYPVNGLYSFKFAGLNGEGLPLFYNHNGTATNQITKYHRSLQMLDYEGSRDPLGSGGLTNMFRYKKMTLSVLFTYAYGNKIRLNSFFQRYYDDISALDAALAQRWTAPGQELYTNVPRIIEAETRTRLLQENADPFTFYNRSNIRVASGSFVRLKNVMLSYVVPATLTKKIGIKSMQINGQAQNLLLWADSKLNGQDPEAMVSGVSIPAATTYTLGLNVNF